MSDAEIDQDEIEQHNERTLWEDVASRLTAAGEEVVNAQGALEDLREGGFADQLQPLVDALRLAAIDAGGRAT